MILLTGASSFLGSSFSNYLLDKNIQHIKLSSIINQNAYTLNNLRKIFEKNRISNVVDFYFPKVSSINSDLRNINFDFTLQENIIYLFNERKDFKTFLISTTKKDNSIYSQKKKEQENLDLVSSIVSNSSKPPVDWAYASLRKQRMAHPPTRILFLW